MVEYVHCETQEEWDFAVIKLERNSVPYKECGDSININNPGCSNFKSKITDAKFYSFQEWCDKFGHINPLIKKQPKFKIKDEVICIKIPKGSDWREVTPVGITFEIGDKLIIEEVGDQSGTIKFKNHNKGFYPQSCFELVTSKSTLSKEEELLAYARKHYPIGTKYNALQPDGTLYNNEGTIKREIIIQESTGNIEGGFGYIYTKSKDKWATIVSKPEEVKESTVTVESSQFVIDRWYRCSCNSNLYQFDGYLENGNFGVKAIINPTNSNHGGTPIGYNEGTNHKGLAEYFKPNNYVKDLSKIAKYLPKTPQFIVGKWYKNLGSCRGFIGKFKEFNDEKTFMTINGEYIYKHEFSKGGIGLTSFYDYAIECSLEEIQQYLPEGHVDKIVKVLVKKDSKGRNLKEFITGKWYMRDGNKSEIRRLESCILKDSFNYHYNHLLFDAILIDGEIRNEHKSIANSDIDLELKEIDITPLLKKKEEQVPKYWFIENKYPEVREYLANKYDEKEIIDWNYPMIGFDNSSNYHGCHGFGTKNGACNGAKEITFEYFKKHIYVEPKKEQSSSKEIVTSKFNIGDEVSTNKGNGVVFGFNKASNTVLVKGIQNGHDACSGCTDKYGNEIIPTGRDNYYFRDSELTLIPKSTVQETTWIPKVGDWVYYIGTAVYTDKRKYLRQIKSITEIQFHFTDGSNNTKLVYRKAEPHEIPTESVTLQDIAGIRSDKPLTEGLVYPYNEGDYIVCNEEVGGWIRKGEIAILGGKYWDQISVNTHYFLKAKTVHNPSGNGCSRKVDFRHATKEEVEAYKKGIRNISDIKQESKEREPKIGDYVVITQSSYIDGIVYKLKTIFGGTYWNLEKHDTVFSYEKDQFRFATDAEIRQELNKGHVGEPYGTKLPYLSDFLQDEIQLLQPKEDKRFDTSVNKIESVKIQLKQKSKSIKF